MSWDLHPEEMIDKASSLPVTQTPEIGVFHNFMEGAAKVAMQGFAKTARAVDLLGAVGPIVEDWSTDVRTSRALGSVPATMPKTVTAQTRYFKESDSLFQSAVDYWTPRPNEVGVAGEVAGSLLSMLPTIMASPSLAVGATQLAQGQDLVREGVSAGKAQAVGAVQALGLGAGIWMPILGTNALQRIVIGGAGFNVAQGVATRAASKAILEGEKAAEQFRPLGGTELTLDILLGLAFGGMAHLNPAQRAQGAKAWEEIGKWLKDAPPSDKAALATLREAQHINVDSLPGTPQTAADLDVHVQRMRAAIESLATDKPVDVENIVKDQPTEPQTPVTPRPSEMGAGQEATARDEKYDVDIKLSKDEKGYTITETDASGTRAGEITHGMGGIYFKDLILNMEGEFVPAKDVRQAGTGEPDPAATPFKPDASNRQAVLDLVAEMEFERAKGNSARVDELAAILADVASGKISAGDALARSAPAAPDTNPRYNPDLARIEQDTAIKEAIQEHARTVAAEEGIPQIPERKTIAQTIEEQLVQAGRPAEEAKAGATLWQAFFDTTASRYGRTGQELFDRYMNGITGQPGEGPSLAQANRVMENPAFRSWFEGSQVAHETGEPMVVYHGTPEDFDVFDHGKTWMSTLGDSGGLGFFFTKNPQEAGHYAQRRGVHGPTMPVYLAIKNPKKIEKYTPEWERLINSKSSAVALREDLIKQGFDGAVTPLGEYVAFHPEQIKSATGNRGTYDPTNPNILFQGAVPWYHSELERQISTAKMGAASPKDWKNFIKGLSNKGVKADEVKWTGLEEWLDLQQGKVTKEQIQQYMKDGGVKVEEVTLGAERDLSVAEADEILQSGGRIYAIPRRNPDQTARATLDDNRTLLPYIRDHADQYLLREGDEKDAHELKVGTKFATYQLPGGENYRELLLTLPGQSPKMPDGWSVQPMEKPTDMRQSITDEWDAWLQENNISAKWNPGDVPKGDWARLSEDAQRFASEIGERWWDAVKNNEQRYTLVGPDGSGIILQSTAKSIADAEKLAIEELQRTGQIPKKQQFNSSHFDQPNILAHIRFNERTDADGKKVLFIEEIQSDWAQKGKKEGFSNSTGREEWVREWTALDRIAPADRTPEQQARFAELDAIQIPPARAVPPAPFVGKTEAWVGLSLKRMIRYAAENGFDRVAWTNGEQQVARYRESLQKAVDVIEWKKTADGVQLVGYQGKKAPEATIEEMLADQRSEIIRNPEGIDAEWGIRYSDGSEAGYDSREIVEQEIRAQWDKDHGANMKRTKVVDTTEKETALSDSIGKAMADKIKNDPNQSGVIEGDDITISDTGMSVFYDKIVPNVANDVLKKLGGGRVGEVDLSSQAVAKLRADKGMEPVRAKQQPGFDITPSMREKAMETQALFQPAYHGTPHTIGPEGFSTTKIGTGEGAQAYGWGLYFAENPEVAAGYHRQLSTDPGVKEMRLGTMILNDRNNFDYSRRASDNEMENVRASLAEDLLINQNALTAAGPGGFRDYVLKVLDERIKDYYDPEHDQKMIAAAQRLRNLLAKPNMLKVEFHPVEGGVYQVDIPDEHAANMLLWDKPLSEQPESVRAAVTPRIEQMRADNPGYVPADPSGDWIYRRMGPQGKEGVYTQEAASRALSALGIPGLKYLDAGSRGASGTGKWKLTFKTGKTEIFNFKPDDDVLAQMGATAEEYGTHNIVVFDDKIIKITHKDGSPVTQAERDAYLQKEAAPGSGERGALQFDQQGKMAIALLKSADPSTFLHESGHFFLEVTNDLAGQPDAPAGMKQDMQTLYSWFGLKDADTWNNMTLDEKRPYHEQFARGFERYLRDGKAPSTGLKDLFRRFRDWLKAVYQSASQLNVEVSDQVRAVMDRMLAEPQRTEAPPEATRSAAPPPPRGGVGEPMGEASVPEGTPPKPYEPKTSDDPQILEMLRDMATNEAGWAQVGGKWMGKAEKGSGVPNFTTWIPKAEWWNDRPDKKMNEAKFVEAVTKHMTDEKMTPAEKRAVQFLTDIANKRLEAKQLYEDAEWNRIAQEVATEGMDPTTQNVVDADAVQIAMQIDEARVERAAITAADDHDFMAEVREIIDGYKPQPDATAAERGTPPAAKPGTTGPAGQEANATGADRDAGNQGVIAQQALRMVAENPDLPIATGVDAQGNTTYQKASEYLAEAKAMADLKRQDVSLFELAAQCLLGGGR